MRSNLEMRRLVLYILIISLALFLAACSGGGGGSSGGGDGGTEATQVPDAPTNVNLVPSDDSITVTWDHVTNATSYNVYCASSPGVTPSGYAALPDGTKIANATNPYVLSGLTTGTTYYVIVTALNSTGESKSSTEQSATPLSVPAAPIGLSGVTAKNEVTLTWDAVPDASSYNLYFATEPGVTASNYSILTNGNKIADVTSPYVVSGLDNESQYYFVVTAENALGESFESLELSAVPGSKGWFWQNPMPTGNQLLGVDFIDQTTGWAIGLGGTILHTSDGGMTWTEQWSGATIAFLDVSAVDSSNVWVVGQKSNYTWDNGNVIIKSTDGGATWTICAMPSMTTSGLRGVDFISATTGWVVGGEGIYHTTDGGKSWVLQKNASSVNKVKFIDANHGWAVAGSGYIGTIYRTSDGGTTWTSDSFGTGASDVDFVDSSKGWIVEYISTGGIYATSNGGITWGPQPTFANYLRSIAFGDGDTGWAVGNFGKIVNTINGGGSWVAQTSGVSAHLNAVAGVDASFAWIVGDGGTILHTSDGGATWNQQNSDLITSSSSGFSSVDFVSDTTGWVVGRNIVQTTDGGTTWTVQVPGLTDVLTDIDFVDSLNGWAVGSSSQILHTVDGGTTWTNQNSSGDFRGVSFINATTGWVVGCYGAILYTADGGTTWVSQASGITSCLMDVAFVDSSNGWAVGQSGIILHTTDGGNSWLGQLSGTANDLRSVFALDSYTAWVVGGNSSASPAIIRKTTDGGATWETLSNGENGWLNTIFFTDALNGWTAAYDGVIFETQDGGSTWTKQSSSVAYPHDILGISFINETTGWAVGGAGVGIILKTDTGGVGP